MRASVPQNGEKPEAVVVCINRRLGADAVSCAGRGSEAVAAALEDGIAHRGLAAALVRLKCLGSCQHGPNVRFAPGGAWFSGVALDDVAEILDHLERLTAGG
ncbi:MAG TPA: (2Fe-2S) ferredoxin domain-containing protein [Alphaproteobacteria bacterium]|jgi:(2Fe-2S) ferredoxin|nr:(2Fe-2S) ferredoxin domain-containing protein [Alphaproteobacteria bacterium]MDP6270408.1 (2Fe-2S) ferredoxin domain-containing protein [Alphaproteobacteria bacterium]MDP7426643.1 (2Fe-2S) ferredoxin domain-containing protein [Alphaproteobacteria bacterium]HJM51454.1 (2Fe-2S) ferredoxin domain-containing protein [Alphaproteobacteria bacterium]|tara:strand:- start:388 stop:693 length:306 start_codon:yes stop_codon:yes gene_type:complete